MTAITFDTLKYANRLKAAGVPDKQAEAMAEAQAEVFEKNLDELATKRDLEVEIAQAKTDIIKWVAAMFIAQAALIVATMFAMFRLFTSH